MRVGLVCPYSLSVPGGVQNQVLGLGRALRRMGVDARILAPCDGPPPDPAVTPLGNSIPAANNGSMAAIAPDPAAALRTIRALRDERFDVVNIHEPLAPGPTLTALVVASCPKVGTFHRSGDSTWVLSLQSLAKWALGHLDVRVAVSEEARQTAIRAGRGTYELVWNGIDVAQYGRAEPWPKTGPVVMFVGRHEERKGLSVLLRASSRLGPDVRIWVASRGPETSLLQARNADDDRIEWLGMISEEEKIRRIKAADVLCAPSLRGESFGIVLLEGMAAGTPVVASDLSGYRAVAADGKSALLPAPGDPSALASALERVLTDDRLAQALVEHGFEQAAKFSMEGLAARYIELYEKAMAG